MPNILWPILASIVVSLISLIGILTLLLKKDILNEILVLLIGFAAGTLIGSAFLQILPESLEQIKPQQAFLYVILGFILFFILEKYLYWRHCHKGVCDIHAFTYLNLIGDGFHNLADGLIIGGSFYVGIKFGMVTTLAIIFHEIPQEIGDFGVLIYGGFTRAKALLYNFLSALTCVLGAITGYLLSRNIIDFSLYLLPFTAGGFIYIASCDLIPELHKQPPLKKAAASMIPFILGVLLMWWLSLTHSH